MFMTLFRNSKNYLSINRLAPITAIVLLLCPENVKNNLYHMVDFYLMKTIYLNNIYSMFIDCKQHLIKKIPKLKVI